MLAFGTENGEVGIGRAAVEGLEKVEVAMVKAELAPAKSVNQIVWRPGRAKGEHQVAVASDDSSVRAYDVRVD